MKPSFEIRRNTRWGWITVGYYWTLSEAQTARERGDVIMEAC